MDERRFEHVEAEIGRVLCVSRETLRAVRGGLVDGVHFDRVGKEIAYSDEGLKWLMVGLGVPDPEGAIRLLNEKKPRPVVTASVARVFPRILMANLDGATIRIRVRKSKNFVPGMAVPCRQIERDLYELVGRCPRWRGKF